MAATGSATVQPTANPGPNKPYVIIAETGVGFLRVRFAPSLAATEAGRVKPGEKYPIIAEGTGWTQIQMASSSGWVNDQYVQKVN